MRLENRLPEEGINSSREHPLREAAWLIGAVLASFALALALIGLGARWLAPKLPFSVELRLMAQFEDAPQAASSAARSQALQALAERVASAMDLPPDMPLQLRAEPLPLVNAYASLGGRIRVYEGLLRRLDSEEALAALLAHEIAHVRQRHVAANAGRGLAVALLLGAVSADAGAAAAQAALGSTAQLGLLAYSREQEAEADALALAALVRLYGHGGGVVSLFDRLQRAAPEGGLPALLRSHPPSGERLAALRARAGQQGWPMQGAATPLAAPLRVQDAPVLSP